jgi:A/G-specific adenine glycosylase
LLTAARFIQNDCKGKFPDTHEVILSLKGVGPYTAAAIASFAYNLPHAVVDGNVMRVLSRFFRIATPIDTTEGKKTFNELAQSLLDSKNAGLYNQAIMDLGATICKPQSPVCSTCPLSGCCNSYKEGDMNLYPVKSKKIQIRHRWFNYFIIKCGESYYVRKRREKDIWQHLHEFVLIETQKAVTAEEWTADSRLKKMLGHSFKVIPQTDLRMQKLTHQHVHGSFFTITIEKAVEVDGYERKTISQIKRLAFPVMIAEFLKENRLLLP